MEAAVRLQEHQLYFLTTRSPDFQKWNVTDENVIEVLDLLSKNEFLESLQLDYHDCFGRVESCRILGLLVQNSKTLWNLSMHKVGLNAEALEHIVKGLLNSSTSILGKLEIGSNPLLGSKGAELVTDLIERGLPHLHTLGIWGPGFSPSDMVPVSIALAKNTTLRQLACGVGYGITHGDGDGPLNILLRAFTPVDTLSPEHAEAQSGLYNRTIFILSLNFEYEKGLAGHLLNVVKQNTTLRVLGLRFFGFSRDEWRPVFKALQLNKTLLELDLHQCGDGLNHAFEDLTECLQVNRTLKAIDFSNTLLQSNGRSVQIQELLKRNERLEKYLGTLKKTLNFVSPRIGRLFLCGSPRAGKTTLR